MCDFFGARLQSFPDSQELPSCRSCSRIYELSYDVNKLKASLLPGYTMLTVLFPDPLGPMTLRDRGLTSTQKVEIRVAHTITVSFSDKPSKGMGFDRSPPIVLNELWLRGEGGKLQ